MTFDELMAVHIGNRAVYKDLLEHCRNKAVVPLLGAGMSMWAGYPSWGKLLLALCGRDETLRSEVRGLLAAFRYEDAAELVERTKGRKDFRRALREKFSAVVVKRESRPDNQYVMARVFTGNLLTTNYDHLIEDLYDDNLEVLNPSNQENQSQVMKRLQSRSGALLKIHGDIDRPDGIVLTERDYESVYGSVPDGYGERLVPHFFRQILSNSSVLFLGASLQSDRTVCIVKEHAPQILTHFAVLPLPERPELYKWGIKTIWIQEGSYDDAYRVLFDRLALDLGVGEFEDIGFSPTRVLIGREASLKQARESWKRQGGEMAPLLWVSGPGGIGKTELCKRICADLTADIKRRVYVSLRGASCVYDLWLQIIRGFKRNPDGLPADALQDAACRLLVRNAPLGVVYLDNAEDLLFALEDHADELQAFYLGIRKIRSLKIGVVVSSRKSLPDGGMGEEIMLSALDDESSEKLFNAVWGRKPDASERAEYEELLRRLEGYPLAIVLCAQQAKNIDRIDLKHWMAVESKTGGDVPCHASLAAALRSTWEIVRSEPGAIAVWGVFHLSCMPLSRKTLRALLNEKVVDAGIGQLKTYGLLYRRADGQYDMLNPIREAFSMFSVPDALVRARKSWVSYFEGLLVRSDQTGVPAHLRVSPQEEDENRREAMGMLPQLWHTMDFLCQCEWTKALASLIDKGRNQFQFDVGSLPVLERMARYFADRSANVNECSLAYQYMGDVLRHLGKVEAAEDSYDTALSLLRRMSMKGVEASMRRNVGIANILRSKGDLFRQIGNASAKALFEEAREMSVACGDKLGEANALGGLCDFFEQEGDLKDAEACCEESMRLYVEVGDELGLANVILKQAELASARGRMEDAAEMSRDVLARYERLGVVQGQGHALVSLGNSLLRLRRCDEAYAAFDDAGKRHAQVKDRQGRANAFVGMAQARLVAGDCKEGSKLVSQARDIYAELGNPAGQAVILELEGDLWRARGDVRRAISSYERAYSAFQDLHGKRDCQRIQAMLESMAGQKNCPSVTIAPEHRINDES